MSVAIVSMHNLFLQEVVNGMVHIHVMYVCNPFVICVSRVCQPAGAKVMSMLLYNNLRVGM